jgi:hypothetical protein
MMENTQRLEIEPEELLVIPTKSRYDLSIQKWGSEREAKARFLSKRKWGDVVEGDQIQKRNIQRIKEGPYGKNMIDRGLLTPDMIARYKVFCSLGGDNHFTHCSQRVLQYSKDHPGEEKYMMGTILDSDRSHGGILYFGVGDMMESAKLGLLVEEWTTLEAIVHNQEGIKVPYNAISDFFIGEYSNLFMSRGDVFNNEIFDDLDKDCEPVMPEKSSGILVVTGAGSGEGSWYNNIHRCYFDKPDEFERSSDIARVILRENQTKSKRDLVKGEVLYIDSYNDDQGIIAPDSHKEHGEDFSIGARAQIKISDLKLKVLRPYNN